MSALSAAISEPTDCCAELLVWRGRIVPHAKSDYRLSEAAHTKLSALFTAVYEKRDLKFGNARLVRNAFEKAITNVANRVVQDPQADGLMLELIEHSDIAIATAFEG